MPPNTDAVPHHALDHADVVGPPRRVVCYSHQRVLARGSVCSHNHAGVVIRYFLARPLEQLCVYGWREGPRRAARRRGLVGGEFETDKYPVLRKQLLNPGCPCGAQIRRQRAEKLSILA